MKCLMSLARRHQPTQVHCHSSRGVLLWQALLIRCGLGTKTAEMKAITACLLCVLSLPKSLELIPSR